MKYKKDIGLSAEAGSVSEEVCKVFEAIAYDMSSALQYDHSTGLMTHCMDVCRRSDGSIRASREQAVWYLLIDDMMSLRMSLPYPLRDDGQPDMISRTAVSKQDLFEEMRQYTRNLPPMFNDKSKVRVVDRDMSYLYANDPTSRWTDYMKPVSCIMSLCDMLKLPKPETKLTNELLSRIPDIVKGFNYWCRWVECDISSIYNNEYSNQFDSCMAGKPTDRFDMYDRLQRGGKLGMIQIMRGEDTHAGRALVWYGSNPDDLYLDRIYTARSHGNKIPAALAAMQDFCAVRGIEKCVHESVQSDIGLEHRNVAISVPFNIYELDEAPYVDSMRYFYSNNVMRNSSRSVSDACLVATFDNTDGSIDRADEDNEDYVETSCGDRVHIDNATYIERHGEYFHNCDIVYTHDDEHELRDDCTELASDHYGHDVYAHDSNVTFIGDLDESYHNDDVVELGDGNRGYWPTHLTIETPDGLYWLPTDEGVVEVDGIWQYREEIETAEEPVQI